MYGFQYMYIEKKSIFSLSERKKRVVRHTVCLVAVFTETPDLFLDQSVYVETR